MTNKEILETGECEENVIGNGILYNIVFYSQISLKSLNKSPIYICNKNKFQLIVQFNDINISISLVVNGLSDSYCRNKFDLFIINKNPLMSIQFTEKSQHPFKASLPFSQITKDEGWIFDENKIKIVFVLKNVDNSTESTQITDYHSALQKKTINVNWSIPELSEWHASDPFDVEFAKVAFMLTLEGDFYCFSMSFVELGIKRLLIKYKLTIHNAKNECKSIQKHSADWITSDFVETKPIEISNIAPEDFNEENGWIENGCLNITVEFTNPIKRLPNFIKNIDFSSKKNEKEEPKKETDNITDNITENKVMNEKENVNNILYKMPEKECIEVNLCKGVYTVEFKPENFLETVFSKKYEIGDIFVTISFDIKQRSVDFLYEGYRSHFLAVAQIIILNRSNSDINFEVMLSKRLTSDDNRLTSREVPFDDTNFESGGWLFEERYLIFQIYFRHAPPNVIVSYLPPIEVPKVTENGGCNVSVEVPKKYFDSKIIPFPTIVINRKKVNIALYFLDDASQVFNMRMLFEGNPMNHIISFEFQVENFKDNTQNKVFKIDTFKSQCFDNQLSSLTKDEMLDEKSGFLNSNNCITFKFHFDCITDSQTYFSSEPPIADFMENNENVNPSNSTISNSPLTYVGLVNQGATCYMNSMLQALFHLPAFRRVVYSIATTGTEDTETSIPLNLQRLFCEMQLSRESCSTEPLTKSFGWGSAETIMQHDVEEFCRVLMDNLDTKLKGTELENSIPDLFRGRARHAIRCVNVEYESVRDEDFLDISIDVKGCRNLQESFKKYIEKEEMKGENQIDAENFGRQDAIMCEEFLEFPPVLHLHLRRFLFDYQQSKMVKVNDYFEFPENIDLTQFLSKDAPGLSKSNVYDLYGVLVHSGGVLGGHYKAFLRTSSQENQWYVFNDSKVARVSSECAIKENYGCSGSENGNPRQFSFDFLGNHENICNDIFSHTEEEENNGLISTGYMLIYVRRDNASIFYSPIPKEEIPQHLQEYVSNNFERKKSQKNNYTQIIDNKTIDIIYKNEDILQTNAINNVLGFKTSDAKKITVDKTTTCSQTYQIMALELKKDINDFRLWHSQFENPTRIIPNNPKLPLSQFTDAKIFVQPKDSKDPVELASDQINLYLKFFFSGKKPHPMRFLKSVVIKNESIFDQCKQIVNEFLGFPADTELVMFMETNLGISSNASLFITTGNILIFTVPDGENLPPIKNHITEFNFLEENEDKNENKNENENENKNENKDEDNSDPKDNSDYNSNNIPIIRPSEFYSEFTENSIYWYSMKDKIVKFKVYDFNRQLEPLFFIETPTKIKCSQVREMIISKDGIAFDNAKDTLLLLSSRKSDYRSTISLIDTKFVFKTFDYVFVSNPQDMGLDHHRLFFLHMKNMSYDDASKIEIFTFDFSFDAKTIDLSISQYAHADRFCDDSSRMRCIRGDKSENGYSRNYYSIILGDLVKTYRKAVSGRIDIGEGPFRCLKIYNCAITADYFEEDQCIELDTMGQFRLEVVPESQRNVAILEKKQKPNDGGNFLIRANYLQKADEDETVSFYSIDKPFGQPFFFDVIKDEVFKDTLVRLRKYMNLPENDTLQSYRFKINVSGLEHERKFTEMLDAMVLYDHCNPKSRLIIALTKNLSNNCYPSAHSTNIHKSQVIKIYN